ncbi:MAG TPA: MBL fold metallo-hydrolase [Gemmatimonadales bacterium]|jgi:ribonuclease Z|nr:MBL fold metallo-hydrolase [Gemmatimonadales bacterium]
MARHGGVLTRRFRVVFPATIAIAASTVLLLSSHHPDDSTPPLAATAMAPTSDSTAIVLLGTGTPRPDANGPATAIVVGNRTFLFDAGSGVEHQLNSAHLPINGLTALFITHLHSDHTLGLPDLILTSWVMGRHTALDAYGPHGLKAMVDHIIAAWQEDIDIRTTGLEHESPGGYRVHVREIAPGVVYDSAGVRITAIPVLHGAWKEAFGYRIDTPDRHIVISGDTRPSDALARAAKGADVLIHEVYPSSALVPEARPGGKDWPAYLRSFHTSDVELGQLAARVTPRLLILDHVVRGGATDSAIVAGVRQGGFTGRVVVGKDLDRY